jgi:acyl-CoA synthetase (AMP-forming)/AMP-acid ligase II
MQGYLNNDEATAATIDADGWLQNGDVGIVDEAGYCAIVDGSRRALGDERPPIRFATFHWRSSPGERSSTDDQD